LLPSTKTLLPSTKTLLPSTKTLFPSTKTLFPSTKTLFPSTKTLLPSTKTWLPSTRTQETVKTPANPLSCQESLKTKQLAGTTTPPPAYLNPAAAKTLLPLKAFSQGRPDSGPLSRQTLETSARLLFTRWRALAAGLSGSFIPVDQILSKKLYFNQIKIAGFA
jgi:hypothetical protein